MKNLIILIFALAIILIPTAGFSQTSTATSTDPGTTPDSPFYFLKVWREQIQTFFTFGAENKAKQYLRLADVRLAEYERMIEKGKTEIAEKTLKKYESQLSRALDKIGELKEKNEDVGGFLDDLKDISDKQLEVLERNLEKIPEAAKKGIEQALESVKKQIEKAEELEDEIEELEDLDEDVDDEDDATSTERESEEEDIELDSQNNSGESGEATLSEVGENLKVSLNLVGAPVGVTQPAHIHAGSCENLGTVKYALKFPINGRSETILEGLLLDDLESEGPFAINVHKSTAEPGVYVACGNLDL